jgi:hypothetical protein
MHELLRTASAPECRGDARLFGRGYFLSIEDAIEQRAAERCPHCLLPLQIAAVTSKFFRPVQALFVCGECGLAVTQNTREPHVQSSMIRWRIRRLV